MGRCRTRARLHFPDFVFFASAPPLYRPGTPNDPKERHFRSRRGARTTFRRMCVSLPPWARVRPALAFFHDFSRFFSEKVNSEGGFRLTVSELMRNDTLHDAIRATSTPPPPFSLRVQCVECKMAVKYESTWHAGHVRCRSAFTPHRYLFFPKIFSRVRTDRRTDRQVKAESAFPPIFPEKWEIALKNCHHNKRALQRVIAKRSGNPLADTISNLDCIQNIKKLYISLEKKKSQKLAGFEPLPG